MRATEHIGEDDIVRAAVDATDVCECVRAHLAACGHCRGQVESLAESLAALAPAAARIVSAPPRPARLVSREPFRRRPLPANFWTVAGLAAAAALILTLTPLLSPPPGPPVAAMVTAQASPAASQPELTLATKPAAPPMARREAARPLAKPLTKPDVMTMVTRWTQAAPTEIFWEPDEAFSGFQTFVISGGQRPADQEFHDLAGPEDDGRS